MKLSIISFTENGKHLSEEIKNKFHKTEIKIQLFTKHDMYDINEVQYVESTIGEWAKDQMFEKNALLFIGACGIAVRAVAPHLIDKLHDSPVLVMDEKGRYVIPILSGHMGGANELAVCIAAKTGAEPVITTATDINEKFAVDLFAKRHGLAIVNKEGIAKVSSKVLAGEEISLCIESAQDMEHIYSTASAGQGYQTNRIQMLDRNCLPPEVRIVPYPPEKPVDILITSKEKSFDATLLLRPKNYVIGLGCKKGKSAEEIDALIMKRLNDLRVSKTQLLALASISRKQNEQGIIEWCHKADIPFLTYTADELQAVAGEFQKSDFVRNTVGVDNVCERAALKACGFGGKLISKKYAQNGMTIAVAIRGKE